MRGFFFSMPASKGCHAAAGLQVKDGHGGWRRVHLLRRLRTLPAGERWVISPGARQRYSETEEWREAMPTSFLKAVAGVFCLAVLLPAAAPAARSSVPAAKPVGVDHAGAMQTAPARLERSGRIVVPVMIDGKGPFRFLLDTGADGSMISARVARALGLVSSRHSGERVEGTTGTERMPWVRIERLRIGSIVKSDVRMPIAQTPVMTGLDGILGMAGFGPVRVAVDFQHGKVAIGPSRRRPMWGYLDIRARRTAGGLLEIPARIGGVRCRAVIDTGAEETLGNFALRNALLRNAAKKAALADVYGVTRQVSPGGLSHSPTLHLGPAAIRNLTIVYSDIPIFKVWGLGSRPAIIIGMNVLGTVDALVLDYPRARLYLLPKPLPGQSIVREQDVFFPWL